MLNGSMLLSIQILATKWLKDSSDITQRITSVTSSGGSVTVWQTIGSSIPCRITRASGNNRDHSEMTASVLEFDETLVYTIPVRITGTVYDFDVVKDMRVTVSGITYNVKGINDKLTDKVFRSYLIEKIK